MIKNRIKTHIGENDTMGKKEYFLAAVMPHMSVILFKNQ